MNVLRELQFHELAGSKQAQGLLRQALPWTKGRDGVEMHQVVAEPSQSIHPHRYKPVC